MGRDAARLFCEVDPFCRSVLAKHWSDVPIYNDVRSLNGADLPHIDILCGGFPCQDVSSGGKRAGIKEGTRSGLWYEYSRLIGEIRPRYAIIENVRGLLSCGIEIVMRDLAALGCDAEWEVLPAPPLVPRTIVKGCSLLPTPTVSGLTEGLGFLLRSNESWESTSNLSAYLIGLEYGLTGREKRQHGKHIADPSFIEWMMGVPKGWTDPAA